MASKKADVSQHGGGQGSTAPKGRRAASFAATRPFPRWTLERALSIAQAIKDKNAGNAWSPKEIAAVIQIGPATNNYYSLTAASRDYGLTTGNRDSNAIELTELGRKAVYPASDEAEIEARREAFLKIDIFRKVLAYYKGNNLPELRYLANVLQENFGLDPALHAEFVELFDKNCRFTGIGTEYSPESKPTGSRLDNSRRAGKSAVVVADPPGTPAGAPVCFVIMPFTERDDRHQTGFFEEVLVNLFTPAATAAGFEVQTAKRPGSDVIQATIVNDLLNANLVLADLTEHNPNVLFELGLRIMAKKPIALVRAKGTGPIFDIDNMLRVEEYDPSLWISTVEKDIPPLTEHIIAAWENRETAPTLMDILLRQS